GTPSGCEGRAAEQKENVKGHPLPGRVEIEEDRLRPGIALFRQDEFARHTAGVAPEVEKIGSRQAVVDQHRGADADAGKLQRRRRADLEPDGRPEPVERRECLAGEAGYCRAAGHGTRFTALTVTNSSSSGCLPSK